MISHSFTKTHLSYEKQILLLESRGLVITDRERARKELQQISYYRLSAYFLPFQTEKDIFIWFSALLYSFIYTYIITIIFRLIKRKGKK